MISTIVHVYINPAKLDEFEAALDTIAQEVVKETTLTFFNLYHDVDEPGHYVMVEHWELTKDEFMNVGVVSHSL